MIRLSWGEVELVLLDGGRFRLDGGAMFGVVPRPLWERERPPDERNRIELALHVLLIDDGHKRTLVDSGAGTRWDAKSREILDLTPRSAAEILAPAGLEPQDVDRVICTHLHFDHAGGNVASVSGRLAPAFPRAEYVVQAGELATARTRNERTAGAYRSDDFEPLVEAGRLVTLEGDQRLDRHIRVELVPGHTPYLQMVLVATEHGTLAFPSDLVPTTSHLRYPYIMAYDLDPLATLESKRRVLPRAAAEGWIVAFQHDARLPLGQLVALGEGRFTARPVHPES